MNDSRHPYKSQLPFGCFFCLSKNYTPRTGLSPVRSYCTILRRPIQLTRRKENYRATGPTSRSGPPVRPQQKPNATFVLSTLRTDANINHDNSDPIGHPVSTLMSIVTSCDFPVVFPQMLESQLPFGGMVDCVTYLFLTTHETTKMSQLPLGGEVDWYQEFRACCRRREGGLNCLSAMMAVVTREGAQTRERRQLPVSIAFRL